MVMMKTLILLLSLTILILDTIPVFSLPIDTSHSLIEHSPIDRSDGFLKLNMPAALLLGRRLVLTLEDVTPNPLTGEVSIDNPILPSSAEVTSTLLSNSTQVRIQIPAESNPPVNKLVSGYQPNMDTMKFIINPNEKCPDGYLPDGTGKCRQVFNTISKKTKPNNAPNRKTFESRINTTTELSFDNSTTSPLKIDNILIFPVDEEIKVEKTDIGEMLNIVRNIPIVDPPLILRERTQIYSSL